MSLTKDDLSEDIRHLIVMDTQFGWRGSTELKHEMMLRLEARGWVSEGHENAEYDLTDEGRSVISAALTTPKPAGAVPLVDASFEAFNEITGLCSNLREGGPVPEDLEGLSSGLESAIDIAANMLAKISDARSAPTPQQPAAEGAVVNQSLTTEGAEAVYQYQTVTNGWHDLLDAADSEKYKAAGWPVRTLYTHSTPAADAGGVTEDMVLRACNAYDKKAEEIEGYASEYPAMHAALTAAITPEVRHGE